MFTSCTSFVSLMYSTAASGYFSVAFKASVLIKQALVAKCGSLQEQEKVLVNVF